MIDLGNASTLKVTGNFDNAGMVGTGIGSGGKNTLSISGMLTNNGPFLMYGNGDVADVATLNNSGYVFIAPGATLNLTNQPNGMTDAVAGSTFYLYGSSSAGSSDGFANLNSVEGTVQLFGQKFADTPGSGTLTIGRGGILVLNSNDQTVAGTTLTINGNVNNSGDIHTGYYGDLSYRTNALTITGNLANQGSLTLFNDGDYFKVNGDLNNTGGISIQADAGGTVLLVGT